MVGLATVFLHVMRYYTCTFSFQIIVEAMPDLKSKVNLGQWEENLFPVYYHLIPN